MTTSADEPVDRSNLTTNKHHLPESPRRDDDEPVQEIALQGTGRPLTEAARNLIEQGQSRFRTVNVFGFVASDYRVLWDKLDALPRGRFCEYGSGFGIATGLAELLGFEAVGIEIAPALVAASQKLLGDLGLQARIEQGDYLARSDQADVYFAYAWFGQMAALERHFANVAPAGSKLLICHGHDDIRCKIAAH